LTDQPSADAPAPAAPPAKPKSKSARRRSREFALQGLYQWLLSRAPAAEIEAHIREQDDFDKCDRAHFDALLHGSIEQAAALDLSFVRHLDRPLAQLSPVEHAVLMIGSWELTNCIEIPYRVAINEAVELAKSFGGTDGHKFVNGVLDKTASDLRPNEARPARPRA
jgi:N utilization substance protein B